jgi:hypothetical protein
MDTKTCNTCGKSKGHWEFSKHPKNSDGLLGRCKECVSKRRQQLAEEKKADG